ncbi:MAG: FAD-dependent oxidoreductase [Bacillota bacterium]
MKSKYDAVVVGAGPAGSATAYILAKNGVDVALLERGDYPGSKNMFGGSVYARHTEEIFPAFWEEAPLERPIVTDQLWLLEHDSAVTIGFTGRRFAKAPYNKFSALRSHFDRWLADKAVTAGAGLVTRALVRNLVYENGLVSRGRLKGVQLDGGEVVEADVVVLAEGVNAFLTKEAGLRGELPPYTMTLYLQEILALPANVIEERFQLAPGEGATIGVMGYPTAGAPGKAGLWTNKETLSITIGSNLYELMKARLSPYILLERVKGHPLLKRLLQGAETVEYKAHLIPKGGFNFVPTLYADNLLVVGDAATMISGRHGTDLAMLTGKHAAETIVQARAKGDFSSKMLAAYRHKLNQTYFMQDIKSAQGSLTYYRSHPDADYLVSSTANSAAYMFFTEEMVTEQEKTKKIFETVKNRQLPVKTAADLYSGMMHWGAF